VRKWLLVVGVALVVALVVVQLVPYRVTNPPVLQEPPWDSARTRELAVRACYDCHSNETETAWFEKIAPVSWLITDHVREGREALNFSEWATGGDEEGDDAGETVLERSMPPSSYTWLGMHPDANLTAAERHELATGLRRTIGDD
jgi:hypothetical protein